MVRHRGDGCHPARWASGDEDEIDAHRRKLRQRVPAPNGHRLIGAKQRAVQIGGHEANPIVVERLAPLHAWPVDDGCVATFRSGRIASASSESKSAGPARSDPDAAHPQATRPLDVPFQVVPDHCGPAVSVRIPSHTPGYRPRTASWHQETDRSTRRQSLCTRPHRPRAALVRWRASTQPRHLSHVRRRPFSTSSSASPT